MPLYNLPEELVGEDRYFEGGFTHWAPGSMQLKRLPAKLMPKGAARRGYVNLYAAYGDDENRRYGIHAEYEFPGTDIVMVTYWTYGGRRIA